VRSMKLLLFVTASVTLCSNCFAEDTLCPREIETTSSLIASPPAGWSVGSATNKTRKDKNRLNDITVYSGNPFDLGTEPADGGSQTNLHNGDTRVVATWNLSLLHDPWVECEYNYTSVTLMKSLSSYKMCTFIFVRNIGGGSGIESFTCK